MADYSLANKEAVISLSVDFSIKHDAKEGTAENIQLFLDDLDKLINTHQDLNKDFFTKFL